MANANENETTEDLITRLTGKGIKKIFFVKKGTYQLKETLVIDEPNVALVGIGNVTLIKAIDKDGIKVKRSENNTGGGDGFVMINIRIIDSDSDWDHNNYSTETTTTATTIDEKKITITNVKSKKYYDKNGTEKITIKIGTEEEKQIKSVNYSKPQLTITTINDEKKIYTLQRNPDEAVKYRINGIEVNDKEGSCLVVEANNTLIEHCFFQRSGNKFNVYYPGPNHNAETLMKGYYEGKFQIENEFKGNTVISSHALDNLSFCLQKDGKVEKNRIHGMLAAWMLKDCTVADNHIINSSCIDGIPLFISLPSEGVNIFNNILISDIFTNVPPPVVRIDIQEDHKFNPQEEIGGRKISERIKKHTYVEIKKNEYKMDGDEFLDRKYCKEYNSDCKKKEKEDESPLEIDETRIIYKEGDQKSLGSNKKLEVYKSREYTLPSEENLFSEGPYVYCMNSLAKNIKDVLEKVR